MFNTRRLLRIALIAALAGVVPAQAQDASALKARHAALQEQLANNQFQRPIYLESVEGTDTLNGDIYARVEQPFAAVGPAMQGLQNWCDILILHLNVKSCRATGDDKLSMHIGRKFDQPLSEATPVAFDYKVAAATPDYLQVVLSADKGPMGTSRYRIVLEASPIDARRSFLHLAYSYHYGMAARIGTKSYLATTGRDKVGFSVVDNKGGKPVYVGGMRGVIERNTMRYYLAIESYLGALSTPAPQRVEKRLLAWHAGVERYPRQLHELEREQYLTMKRKEIQRQQDPGRYS